tara:strand:+ start:183 stop:776 length:594 start_codon:yes stop_codon:yes gene_type:complete
MPRILPQQENDMSPEYKSLLQHSGANMGFKSNDIFTLARVPGVIEGLGMITKSIYGKDGLITNHLKRLISIITSSASGCTYCQAHTVHGAKQAGVDDEKLAAVWDYENSNLFSEPEKAALRVAQGAGFSPVEVTDKQFSDLKNYFSDNQICEIVAVISLFGFLNKWNATLATDIESTPLRTFENVKKDNKTLLTNNT